MSLDKEHPKHSDRRSPSAAFSLSAVIDVECVIYTQALIFSFGTYSKHLLSMALKSRTLHILFATEWTEGEKGN